MKAVEIYKLFTGKKWTLSTAESCTGGAISSMLTQVPGASDYFLGGVVAYSNDLKINALKVNLSVIQSHGAVSREVAIAMANGVQSLTGSDWAIATTGVAGPTGGSEEKPVGTVWCAIVQAGKEPYAWVSHFKGDRSEIILQACESVLDKLWEEGCNK